MSHIRGLMFPLRGQTLKPQNPSINVVIGRRTHGIPSLDHYQQSSIAGKTQPML